MYISFITTNLLDNRGISNLSHSFTSPPFRCFRSLGAPLLGVLILDTTTITRPAADAALPPPATTGVASAALALLVGTDTDAKEQVCEEQGSPGRPHEAKSVAADTGAAAVGLEGIAGFDEDGAGGRSV